MMRVGFHVGPLVFVGRPARRRPRSAQPAWWKATAALIAIAGVLALYLSLK